MNLRCLVVLFSILMSASLLAQRGDVRGFVYDKDTGEPIIFTNVYLEGTTMGSSTDINGLYSINQVPEGIYTLVSTYIGYDTTKVQIEIIANRLLNQKLFIKKTEIVLDQITISAEKEEARTEVKTSTIKITPKQINKIPAVGGEPDLAQYLQVLPGVTFTGDQGGQLYIRGGSPIQTKVLLDGLTVYNPFHSIGLFSVFETDLIRNVEVLTGGFNASYGGRISAVIDVTTKDGNKKRMSGKLSANPFLAKLMLEGPIVKLKEDGASASYVLSWKNSYLDRSSKSLYSYINEDGLPYSFNDIFGKVSFNSDNGSKISLFGFSYNDNVKLEATGEFDWSTFGIGSNFVLVPGRSKAIISGKFAYSNYEILLRSEGQSDRTSSIGGFDFGVNFKYYLENGAIDYGIDLSGFATDFLFFNSLNLPVEQSQNTTEIGAYFVYRTSLGKLVIEPSMRVNYYASLSKGQLEPRFGLKYNATKKLRFKASGGRYTQNFISTKSDQDVVNLFTGFLSAPEGLLEDREGEQVQHNLQTALHAIGGVEIDVTKNIELNVEGYYKRFSQLININRNKLFASDSDYIVETGDAYGLDILLKYDYKRLFVWMAYSLGFVDRQGVNTKLNAITYSPHFDRRHNMNFLASYKAGRNLDWEFSARWNFGSGFPFTRTQGYYPEIDFSDGIQTDLLGENGDLGIIFEDQLNAGRLPTYHRLDFSVKKKFFFGDRAVLEAVGSVTNVYDRKNIFFRDRVTQEEVFQLPILPSLGLSFSF